MFKKLNEIFSVNSVSGQVQYLIVGLGNPGKEYDITRHNSGFMAVDAIKEKYNFKIDRLKFKSLCGDTTIKGKRVLFIKPSTFMNLSGEAVRDAMQFYKIPMENVIVIYDDVSLDVGKMRIRRKGSDGGHNGIKNIIYLTGKDTFPRIKIGVGKKPHPDYDLADWVLGKFTKSEQKELSKVFEATIDAVELLVDGKVDEAMNKYN